MPSSPNISGEVTVLGCLENDSGVCTLMVNHDGIVLKIEVISTLPGWHPGKDDRINVFTLDDDLCIEPFGWNEENKERLNDARTYRDEAKKNKKENLRRSLIAIENNDASRNHVLAENDRERKNASKKK